MIDKNNERKPLVWVIVDKFILMICDMIEDN